MDAHSRQHPPLRIILLSSLHAKTRPLLLGRVLAMAGLLLRVITARGERTAHRTLFLIGALMILAGLCLELILMLGHWWHQPASDPGQ